MLKNFSQQFEKSLPVYYLLLQDNRNPETLHVIEDDCGCCYLPSLEVRGDEDVALTLVKKLYSLGFATSSYSEVFREFSTVYSLADDTPGALEESIYLRVRVDVSPTTASARQLPRPMLIYDVQDEVHAPSANVAIARLMQEIDYTLK
jgi:hypothetical protein